MVEWEQPGISAALSTLAVATETTARVLVRMHWPPRGTAIDAHPRILIPLVCMRWLRGPLGSPPLTRFNYVNSGLLARCYQPQSLH